ncbi:unnamed protein product [Phytophthora fragariaefolia]|uniref:Unnamed protein product n=1 Tax=Phytophthora fragariaefolia TaxID=1490495 RepID=A0A9W6X5P7_9STRA|nr:unnamed protein product [Phytophthora fragariaefolia]
MRNRFRNWNPRVIVSDHHTCTLFEVTARPAPSADAATERQIEVKVETGTKGRPAPSPDVATECSSPRPRPAPSPRAPSAAPAPASCAAAATGVTFKVAHHLVRHREFEVKVQTSPKCRRCHRVFQSRAEAKPQRDATLVMSSAPAAVRQAIENWTEVGPFRRQPAQPGETSFIFD